MKPIWTAVAASLGLQGCSSSTAQGPNDGEGRAQGAIDRRQESTGSTSEREAGAGETEGEACQGASHPFFELARQAFGQSPVALTAAEAVERTDIIAVGHLTGVSQGHTVDYREGVSNPVRTIVMSFRVDRTLKGPAADFQYVEYVSGAFDASQFADLLPLAMPVMVFLRGTTRWSESTYVIENEGQGLPQGEVLRSFFPLIQAVVDCRGELEYPLGDETGGALFAARSLAELETEVLALLP